MTTIHKVLMLDGKTATTLDDWVLHHGFNHDYKPGDLIELRESIFVLNNDLIPAQSATEDQVYETIEQEWTDKPNWAE
jgi:hypothetical protein